MRTSKMTFACICLVGLMQLAWGQHANAQTLKYGTYSFYLTMTVSTAVPSGAVVSCTVTLSETGDSNGTYFENASVVATHLSGATYTCNVPISYAWSLSTPATDEVLISYNVDISEALTVGTTSKIVPIRSSQYTAPPAMGVPSVNDTLTIVSYGVKL